MTIKEMLEKVSAYNDVAVARKYKPVDLYMSINKGYWKFKVSSFVDLSFQIHKIYYKNTAYTFMNYDGYEINQHVKIELPAEDEDEDDDDGTYYCDIYFYVK